MKRLFPLILLLALLPGCAGESKPATAQFFAMDTVMSATIYGEGAGENLADVQREVNRLDALWSRTRPESDVARLNAAAGDGTWVALDRDTYNLLSFSQTLGERTGGALDVAIAPVMDAWGFGTADSFSDAVYRVPSRSELDALLPLTDAAGLALNESPDGCSGRLAAPGMAVDLGAVAKGESALLLRDMLLDRGVKSALLDLGGNLTVLGGKPDGSPWRVGVKDPRDPESYFCVLSLTDKTCSTSGGYERYFVEDGVTYHHIIDPATGYPADSGLLSVTAVSTDGALADGLSTACFVLGPDRALALWRDAPAGTFDLVLVRADGGVLVTEGLEDGFALHGEEAGYTYEIVRR